MAPETDSLPENGNIKPVPVSRTGFMISVCDTICLDVGHGITRSFR